MADHKCELWIFGYGSLVWNPGFDYEQCQVATVMGFKRAFWQASHDHRGTQDYPGRVVTLVAEANSQCVGVVFKITHDIDQTLKALDHREKDGYVRKNLSVVPVGTDVELSAVTWIASVDHSSWRGGEPISQTAKVIANATGPSGSNRDYLINLHQTLKNLQINDEYVSELHELVTSDCSLS